MKKMKHIKRRILLILITSIITSVSLPTMTLGSSEIQKSTDTILIIDLFGYIVCPTDEDPIKPEETGQLKIIQNRDAKFVDIEVSLKDMSFYYHTISVEKEFFLDSKGCFMIRYEIDDPLKGFFMEIKCLTHITLCNLAFDNSICQFNYDGILDKGFDNFELISTIEPLTSMTHLEMPRNYDVSSNEIRQTILLQQKNSLFIDNKNYFKKIETQSPLSAITFTNYGIVHENWIRYDHWIGKILHPTQLPAYWETETDIDIAIRRNHAHESQVKSDLQYYNRDQIELGHGYSRNILAYEMVCHGDETPIEGTWYLWTHEYVLWLWPFWYVWVWAHTGTITPSEIEALWYHSVQGNVEIDVKPWNTIVFADVCCGYTDSSSGMSQAWVDNGAEAFIGATITVPVCDGDYLINDEIMWAFWEELCENGGTVSSATIALCNTPYGISANWNLGDEWKIMGNQYAILS